MLPNYRPQRASKLLIKCGSVRAAAMLAAAAATLFLWNNTAYNLESPGVVEAAPDRASEVDLCALRALVANRNKNPVGPGTHGLQVQAATSHQENLHSSPEEPEIRNLNLDFAKWLVVDEEHRFFFCQIPKVRRVPLAFALS
jgi:hypothetical protein